MRLMKNTPIIYMASVLALIAGTSSCIKEAQFQMPAGTNCIKVRLVEPEIQVKSTEISDDIYAYISSDIEAGNLNPIAYSVKTSEGYLMYNIPEGTDDVIFTNVSPDHKNVSISVDEGGNMVFAVKGGEQSADLQGDEILYSKLGNLSASTEDVHNVELNRLNSIAHVFFSVVDANGNALPDSSVESVTISLGNIGHSIAVKNGEVVSSTTIGEDYDCVMTRSDESTRNPLYFIPTEKEASYKVNVKMTDGTSKLYQKKFETAFERNRSYDIFFKMKKLNGSFEFYIESGYTSGYSTNQLNKIECFDLSSGRVVGGAANDSLDINVSSRIPYGWTFSVDDAANDFFTFEKIENVLRIKAKSDNENELRKAEVKLKSDNGQTQDLSIFQKTVNNPKITMTASGNYSYIYFFVSGENLKIKGPGDSAPVEYPGTITNQRIRIGNISSGSEIIVEGDVITYFRGTDSNDTYYTDELGYSYYDSNYGGYFPADYCLTYNFENCIFLEQLAIYPANTALDLSNLPSLKMFYMYSDMTGKVTLGDNQQIESFTAHNCDKISSFDLTKCKSSLKKLNVYDCGGLTGIILSSYEQLKYLNTNGCNSMGVINLNGCSSLEILNIDSNSAKTLNISNCPSLTDVTLRNMNCDKIITEGTSNIEQFNTNNFRIAEFDFSGMIKLKGVGTMACSNFNVSGCSSLENVGRIEQVRYVDVSSCPQVSRLEIVFQSSYTDHSLNCEGTPVNYIYTKYLNNTIDFSGMKSLETLKLDYCYSNIPSFDFSANTKLKDLYIYMSSNNYNTANSIIVPKSLTKLNLRNLYYLAGTLDLSESKALEELDIYECGYYNNNSQSLALNLSGCSALKTVNKDENNNSFTNAYCPYLNSVNLSGCSSLEEFGMSRSGLSSLDFTDCVNLFKFDVEYNNLESTAIDYMIKTLPDRSNDPTQGKYVVSGNPGASTYDQSAAENKGWWR